MARMIDDRMDRPRDDLMTMLAEARKNPANSPAINCNRLLQYDPERRARGDDQPDRSHLCICCSRIRTNGSNSREDPALIDSAVEEALRYDAPKQRNFRRVKKSHIFQGIQFEKEEMVFQLIGAANHDPRKFRNPDKFDIRRSKNEHLTFGAGIHFCIGAFLARKEAKIVLQTILETMPECRLCDRNIQWQEQVQFRGPGELWIECD